MDKSNQYDPNHDALMQRVHAARDASQGVPGAHERAIDSRNGDFIERMPATLHPDGPSIKVAEHFDPEVDRMKIKAHAATETKGGSTTEYHTRAVHSHYRDGSEDTFGKVVIQRRDQAGNSYSHTFRNPETAQKFAGLIADHVTRRAKTAKEQNRRIA